MAKMFDGEEFRGTVDSFRHVRQRLYYHVTYTDGDEEELSQAELRDGYLLGLSKEIESQWLAFQRDDAQSTVQDTDNHSDGDTSDGEGSEYDTRDYESEVKNTKRKRKESPKRAPTNKTKELYGVVLPQSGDKTVAGEAYASHKKNWCRTRSTSRPNRFGIFPL